MFLNFNSELGRDKVKKKKKLNPTQNRAGHLAHNTSN